MYTGVKAEAKPIASPPANLATEKTVRLFAVALPIADAVKRSAEPIRLLRRPKRSLKIPAPAAPIKQPRSRELAAISVEKLFRANWRRRKTRAPLITAVSNPNKKPEIAATEATIHT